MLHYKPDIKQYTKIGRCVNNFMKVVKLKMQR